MLVRGNKGTQQSSQQVRAPRESRNTLQSKNKGRIIDVISEGPIVGLVNGLQSIYLDDTPMENSDGTLNFEGVTIAERYGEPDQDYMPGFPSVEEEVSVGVIVNQATPVVRQVTDTDIDAILVKIRMPQLTRTVTSTGDLVGSKVEFDIEYQPNGGSYIKIPSHNYVWEDFSGGTTSSVQVTGLKATMSTTVSGRSGTRQSVTLTVQYRATGSGTWLTLGTRTMTVTIPGRTSSSDTNLSPNSIRSKTVSASFELTGLTEDEYEIQAVSGTITKSQQKVYAPIAIKGKTTSPYEESFRLDLTGSAPWNIRVTRVTADSTSVFVNNDIYFSSYTKITDAKLSYPDTALVGIEVDAEQFGQELPSRAYEVKGLKIQIPSNYDPDTRAYTGIWDGTFQTEWTDNPAWVLYDILTNSRYGLGDFLEASQIDKWSFYDIAQYCDELVDDGYGGTEPRFTFNGVINSRQEAYDVINAISAAFRGMVYWDQGAIYTVQDSPNDAEILVTPDNVINGIFNYSSSSLKARHNTALVTWNDPEQGYKSTIEVVEDPDSIYEHGVRQLDTVAMFCTSRGQAHRWGKWILDSERYETETVTYNCSFDHVNCRPGDIISIADPTYAGVEMGGRIADFSADTIVGDKAVTFEAGQTYTIAWVAQNGTIAERSLINPESETTYFDFSLPMGSDEEPNIGAMYVITSSNVEPRLFRVLAVRETDRGIYEITALFHDPTKYDRVENNVQLEFPDYTIFNDGPLEPPENLAINEYKYIDNSGLVQAAALLSWTPPNDPRVGLYEIQMQEPAGEGFIFIDQTFSTSVKILNVTQGSYTFMVRSLDYLGGFKSEYAVASFELSGLFDVPEDITNFNMNIIDGTTYLSWDPVTDLDLDYYQIRYSPEIGASSWGSMNMLIPRISKNQTSTHVPLTTGTYAIKAVDTSGIESTNALYISSNILEVLFRNVVVTFSEDPTWAGEMDGTVFLDGNLQLGGADTIDDWLNIDNVLNVDIGNAGIIDGGTYLIPAANIVDLGAVYTSRVTPNITALGTNLLSFVDQWTNVDDIANWDGADSSQWEIVTQIRHTSDDPNASALWSEWKRLIVGDYTARAFDFRLMLLSYSEGVSPLISAASFTIDMPDRVAEGYDIVSGTGTYSVTYSPAFKATPTAQITAKNLATGDYWTITNESATGFDIAFKNSGGSGVSRTFNYVARGYGAVSADLPLP